MIRRTGLIVTSGKNLLNTQRAAWNEAIDEYNRLKQRQQ